MGGLYISIVFCKLVAWMPLIAVVVHMYTFIVKFGKILGIYKG
mgnify:FL=1